MELEEKGEMERQQQRWRQIRRVSALGLLVVAWMHG
jgi:hypothetical protein